MIRALPIILLLFCAAAATPPLDWSAVASVALPTGAVASVSIDGTNVWTRPNPIPYVTDGLVAWWDGIWNVGINVHDSSATVWKDLVGNRDLTLASSGVSWTSNALRSEISSGCAAKCAAGFDVSKAVTVEFVISSNLGRTKLIVNPSSVASASTKGVFLQQNSTDASLLSFSGTANRICKANFKAAKSISVRYSDPGAAAASCVVDGATKALSNYSGWNNSSGYAGIRVFGRTDGDAYTAANSYPSRGDCFCIRIYNRALTDAEIARNHASDKTRFNLP